MVSHRRASNPSDVCSHQFAPSSDFLLRTGGKKEKAAQVRRTKGPRQGENRKSALELERSNLFEAPPGAGRKRLSSEDAPPPAGAGQEHRAPPHSPPRKGLGGFSRGHSSSPLLPLRTLSPKAPSPAAYANQESRDSPGLRPLEELEPRRTPRPAQPEVRNSPAPRGSCPGP